MDRQKKFIQLQLRRLGKVPQWLRLLTTALVKRKSSTLAATSMDLCDNKNLSIIFGNERPQFYSRLLGTNAPTVIGWGRKWSGMRAAKYAQKTGKACMLVEDGFLRSVGRRDDPLSFITDTQGIYYDARNASQLEALIAIPLTAAQTDRSLQIVDLWRHERVSKYNDSPSFLGPLPQEYVLVIDQVAGDLSISAGCADKSSFTAMLDAALAEHPDAKIVLKTHPDLQSHARNGHFDLDALSNNPRIQVISTACHPVRLIANARAIYTVTSQVGFEALIWGKPVRCFGMPFYAGYGLTDDTIAAPTRRTQASVNQLVHAALVAYPSYIDSETKTVTDPETVIRHVGNHRRAVKDISGVVYAIGFSAWKRPVLDQFLKGTQINHVKKRHQVPKGATIAIWGSQAVDEVIGCNRILRIEDGFLRSAGLGADLIRPMSWTIDDLGIYYDPRTPSRLEAILQAQAFDTKILDRARDLITQVCAKGISKYNVGGNNWTRPKTDQRIILVPGQVENDASIQAGACKVKTNIALLRAVRAGHPDAYIIYKPHPDIVTGLRRGGTMRTNSLCDEIVTDVDPIAMLPHVDEVHTMTSLLGFEALLRDVKVTCYGQPFYAGWGLTDDCQPVARRTATLSIEELVAGSLIAYPRYVSRVSGYLTTPERAITELVKWRKASPSKLPISRRILRNILRLWAQSGLRRNA